MALRDPTTDCYRPRRRCATRGCGMVLTSHNRSGLYGLFCRSCAARLAAIRDELDAAGQAVQPRAIVRRRRNGGRPMLPKTRALEAALLTALAEGPRSSREVKDSLLDAGFGEHPIQNAAKRMRQRGELIIDPVAGTCTTVWSRAPWASASL